MADAKVIPFDDDRSRSGGGSRPARRRTGTGSGGRSDGSTAPVSALPGGRLPEPSPGSPASSEGGEKPQQPLEPSDSPESLEFPESLESLESSEVPVGAADGGWERRIAGGLAFLRRRVTGDYEVDEFGYDKELTDQVLMSALRPLADKYFRVEVKGIENIPSDGGALIVANHSGTLPLDGLMLQVAVHDHHPAERHLRLLAADLVFHLPVVNELARKAGHTLACAEDAQRLLELGEIVGVMPEGFKGIGKPFGDRYKLQRFGRGGFVSTALRAGAPIVPCSIVGAEEIYPMIGNAKTLARLLGFPYFPITPTFPWLGPLGALPLPTKWTIQFGEPIPTDGYPPEAAEDPMLMFNLTDQVREQIQHTLYKLLVQRRSVFF
ncbi:lysophospholipid acyltransferase family protein [Streptomyces sp. NPDC059452]|uniref:lysophospholipid acyltransferase family protein n=1 Tax=Streptomyces sp. NPDC059452 TaxID=3346835 RepID=UPI00368AF736